MSKRVRVQTFGFMQYLQPKYWDWTDDEKEQHFTNSDSVLKHICSRIWHGLQQAGETGDDLEFEFAGINHDKDTDLVWDGRHQMEVIEAIPEHVHGVVTLSKKRDLNVIAQWIGLKPEYIDIPRGRYGKENMLAYLVHAKQPDKYQYDPREVMTFGTFDYIAYWEGKKPAWDRHKATVQTKHNKVSADWLVKQVQLGLISMREIMSHDSYSQIYADNMTAIDDAFRFYGLKKGFETLEALENGEFELSVLFITGSSGSGKTQFALDLIKRREIENGWRSYQASPTNPMDEYNGEEIVLLDDLRAQSLGATAWLQLLDPRTSAHMGARYKNKQKAFRTLVITSYLNPYEFFSYVKGDGGANEALDQFIRRIMMIVEIYRLDDATRMVEIEAIGHTPEKVVYDLESKQFLNQGVLSNYNNYGFNRKELSFAGFPVYKGTPDKAQEFLSNVINDKNNPSKDHSKIDRPNIGESMRFLTYDPDFNSEVFGLKGSDKIDE